MSEPVKKDETLDVIVNSAFRTGYRRALLDVLPLLAENGTSREILLEISKLTPPDPNFL